LPAQAAGLAPPGKIFAASRRSPALEPRDVGSVATTLRRVATDSAIRDQIE
jgi:hypothetical protein